MEGMVKETETAYSKRAVELEGIKLENETLQKIVQSRDEKIVSLTNINLKLKDEVLKGTGKETVENGRTRIEFRASYPTYEPYLTIFGHTLTNPPEYELDFTWDRALKLDIVVAYDRKTRTFRSYVDTKGSDIIPTKIDFVFDADQLKDRWYEKIAIGNGIIVGDNRSALLKFNLAYNILNEFILMPDFMLGFSEAGVSRYYGLSVMWYPWK